MKRFLFLLLLPGFSNCIHAQTITTIVGKPGVGSYTGDGGKAVDATLNLPWTIAFDPEGNMYIADGLNSVFRKVGVDGLISTFAGNGKRGYSGDNGPAIAAEFNYTAYMAIDPLGNKYISDYNNHVIRKINPAGIITTIAGVGRYGTSPDGTPALAAMILPSDLAVDASGKLFFVDKTLVRTIDPDGKIRTVAGDPNSPGSRAEGIPAIQANLNPAGITIDRHGNLYICEPGDARVRKVNTSGIINTIAGTSVHGYSGDGGPAILAEVDDPYDIAVDHIGNIYLAHHQHHVIRKVDPAGIITTFAGNGTKGYSGDGGQAPNAQLTWPVTLAVDKNGSLYISDVTNHTIRKIEVCINTVVPGLSISSSANSICEDSLVKFIAVPVNAGSAPKYQWKINGVNVGTNKSDFESGNLKDGDEVSCIMIPDIPCASSVTSSNMIRMIVHPKPGLNMGADVMVSPGGSIRLEPTTTGRIVEYSWTPVPGLSNVSILNPVASPSITTTYRLEVVSDRGCKAEGRIKVVVYKQLRMPTAFTPNNDRHHDVFRIPPGTTMELKEFSIYSRWGNKVFSTSDINEGWDGTVNGKVADAGGYVFIITGVDPEGKVLAKGSFLLIR